MHQRHVEIEAAIGHRPQQQRGRQRFGQRGDAKRCFSADRVARVDITYAKATGLGDAAVDNDGIADPGRLQFIEPLGQQIAERGDRPALADALDAARHAGIRQSLTIRAPGHDEPLRAVIEPYRESGRGNLLLSLLPGTEQAPGAMADNAESALLDGFPEALVIIDRKGMIAAGNDHFLDLIHVLNRSMVIDRNLNGWLGASSVDLQVLLSRVKEEGQVRQFSTVIRDELGTTRPVAVSAAHMSGDADGQRIGMVITEGARRESQFCVPAPGLAGDSSDFAELVGRVPLKDLVRQAVDVIEKMCIEAALRQTGNNRASAADMLGLSRQSLYIKLRRHGLEDFRSSR